MTDTVDIEELEGRAAYDAGEPWSSTKPEAWRRGWIARQYHAAPLKNARDRAEATQMRALLKPRELKAFEQTAREMTEDKP